jgi:hypothetical protein
MKLISLQEAAEQMDVPVSWVNGMKSQGLLADHKTKEGAQLIDADELIVKRYVSKEFEVPSLEHVQSMLKKFAIEARV